MASSAEQQQTALLMAEAATDGFVVVKVGPDAKKFNIHKTVLCHNSCYFKNALVGPWVETQTGVVELDDVEPKIFSLFVEWIYSRRIAWTLDTGELCLVPSYILDRTRIETDYKSLFKLITNEPNELFITLLKCYILGDRLLAIEFRQQAIKRIIACMKASIRPRDFFEFVQYAYKYIPQDRPILQALVDYCCDGIGFQAEHLICDREDIYHNLPEDFKRRVVFRYTEMMGRFQSKYDRCYEHEDDDNKDQCKSLHMIWDAKISLARFEGIEKRICTGGWGR